MSPSEIRSQPSARRNLRSSRLCELVQLLNDALQPIQGAVESVLRLATDSGRGVHEFWTAKPRILREECIRGFDGGATVLAMRRHAETPSQFIQHWEPRRLPNNTPEGLREAARRAAVKARVDAILARAGITGALSKVTS